MKKPCFTLVLPAAFMAVFAAVGTGCGSSDTPDSGPVLVSVTVSSDRPLIAGYFDTDFTPLVPTGNGSTPAVGGSGSGSGLSSTGTVDTSITDSSKESGTTLTSSSGPLSTADIFLSDWSATITVNTTWTSTSQSASCAVQTPFEAIACNAGGFTGSTSFTVNKADITGGGSLSVNVYPTEDSSSSKSSNSLSAGRLRVRKIGTQLSDFYNSTVVGSNFYFVASKTAVSGEKLMKFDGSSITQLSNTTGNVNLGDFAFMPNLTAIGTDLYFSSINNNPGMGIKLFKLNTLDDSITQVSNVSGDQGWDDNVWEMIAYGSDLYFVAETEPGVSKLFKLSGGSVTRVSNTASNVDVTDNVGGLAVLGSYLYFGGETSSGLVKAFRTDGTSELKRLTNTAGTSNDDNDDGSYFQFTTLGSNLYFAAKQNTGVVQLYRTTANAVYRLTNFSANTEISSLTSFKNQIYFVTNQDGVYLNHLYKMVPDPKPTNYAHVKFVDTNPNDDDNPMNLFASDDYLYFSALNAHGVSKLFRTDGTTASQVSNTAGADDEDDNPMPVYASGAVVYFSATDSLGFKRLFKSDGSKVYQVVTLNEFDDDLGFDYDFNRGCGEEIPRMRAFNGKLYINMYGNSSPCDQSLYEICDPDLGCT